MGILVIENFIANICSLGQVFEHIQPSPVPINDKTSEEGAALPNDFLDYSHRLQETTSKAHQPMPPPLNGQREKIVRTASASPDRSYYRPSPIRQSSYHRACPAWSPLALTCTCTDYATIYSPMKSWTSRKISASSSMYPTSIRHHSIHQSTTVGTNLSRLLQYRRHLKHHAKDIFATILGDEASSVETDKENICT